MAPNWAKRDALGRKVRSSRKSRVRSSSQYDPAAGGTGQESEWQPALAEIEDALVPAFIVEVLGDGRFTVVVPSSPTPLAGAIYILNPERVHPLNVSFAQAVNVVTRWGSGSKALVEAMQERRNGNYLPDAGTAEGQFPVSHLLSITAC